MTICTGVVVAGLLSLFATVEGADLHTGEWFRVTSDWEPDAASARLAAQTRLNEAVGRWLAAERPESATWAGSPAHLRRLLSRPDVVIRRSEERRERPYGTVVRVWLEAGLTPAAVDGWTQEMEDFRRRRIAAGLAKAALIVVGWGLLALAVRWCDIRTCGYRRTPLLVAGALAAILLAAVAGAW
jgi:hypothetical protein